jgi:hypothetical protein
MSRGVRRYVVAGLLAALAVLAGCARNWFAEREPWRHDAEAACLQSGAVKEGPAITVMPPISGPGVCGADFPLRVAALGEPGVLGYADEAVRPPAGIPGAPDYGRPPAVPRYPASPTYTLAPPPTYPGSGAPLSLAPPAGPAQPYSPEAYSPRAPDPEPVPLGRPAPAALAAGPATVTPAATLACPLVSTLDRYFSESVQPAAMHWFGQPVVEVKQISAYSCRGMNGDSNAHISEHAFGNALDMAAFVLADGHRVTVKDGWHGSPEEQGFLHDIQGAACQMFTTVLAPGSNAFHYDHIHVDLMRRASRRVICQPAAIPGEVAAAHAAGRYGGRPGTPYTGSLGPRSPGRGPLGYDEDDAFHSSGVPGAD